MRRWAIKLVVSFGVLAAAAPELAADPLHGRWAIDPKGCAFSGDTAQTAVLTVDDKTVNWFVARCTIRKTYKIGDALHLEARCWNEGKMKDIPVSLVPRGQKLAVTWDRAPAGEMTRCR